MKGHWLMLLALASCWADADEPSSPGLEMLEYLGQWEESGQEEEWLDPVTLYQAGVLGQRQDETDGQVTEEQQER